MAHSYAVLAKTYARDYDAVITGNISICDWMASILFDQGLLILIYLNSLQWV